MKMPTREAPSRGTGHFSKSERLPCCKRHVNVRERRRESAVCWMSAHENEGASCWCKCPLHGHLHANNSAAWQSCALPFSNHSLNMLFYCPGNCTYTIRPWTQIPSLAKTIQMTLMPSPLPTEKVLLLPSPHTLLGGLPSHTSHQR